MKYPAIWRLWERTVSGLVHYHPVQSSCNLSVVHWNEVFSLMKTLGNERTQPVAIVIIT